MPSFFTVRWPLFARLEAVLLFPVALMLVTLLGPVRTAVDKGVVPWLAPVGTFLSLSKPEIIWISVALAGIVPYFVVLLVVDRLLTVRKGFALLSVVAIAIWVGAAMRFADQFPGFLPQHVAEAIRFLVPNQLMPVLIGGLALLAHLVPLWKGLRDQGDVAMRLLADREERDHRRPRDVYDRQTADFRGWRSERQFAGLTEGARENRAVKVLFALAWIGAVVGAGVAWHYWQNSVSVGRGVGKDERATEVPIKLAAVGRGVTIGASVPGALPIAVTPGMSAHAAVVNAPLPAVQRPAEPMPMVQTPSAPVGSQNEASAGRGRDGTFVFDAVVNGTHLPMMFDTGASMVSIRAEDAGRLGIDVTQLSYSGRVRTGNGIAEVAPVTIDLITVGEITLRNVAGSVSRRGALRDNLLGQTFLARLAAFNVENNRLVLRGH